ncbi:hypothetical protein [Natrinema sp. SYSU A 869]|uniref:hypothetical protein n=1 Tax=Natrinema sp. SYSU A 869 TaxID=2871694 RepID=UPI001CA41F5E|nr:hypothetical protein [Natrinema sp. SYSU A 869]
MATRISRIFGSYDLFAKSFPGVILLILTVTLLPVWEMNIETSLNNTTIVLYGILMAVFGFTIGQALHSVAVDIEKTVYAFGSFYYKIVIELMYFNSYARSALQSRLPWKKQDIDVTKGAKMSRVALVWAILFAIVTLYMVIYAIISREFTLMISVFSGYVLGVVIVSDRLRTWFYNVLNPHRRIFQQYLYKNDQLATRYLERYIDVFDSDGEIKEQDDQYLIYMMTMSYLENIGSTRSRQFQATFSFCRSIWVILAWYAVVCVTISIGMIEKAVNLVYIIYPIDSSVSYTPMILNWTNSEGTFIIGLIMGILSLCFMEGERQYKYLFIKYLMVDFLTTTNEK